MVQPQIPCSVQNKQRSASILLDCYPYKQLDTENVAETFIGKLFSEESNIEQNLLD